MLFPSLLVILPGGGRSSSCSRNAHDKNVLVRRAQSRIDQATLLSALQVSDGWKHVDGDRAEDNAQWQ
jgi:hypothetical protein